MHDICLTNDVIFHSHPHGGKQKAGFWALRCDTLSIKYQCVSIVSEHGWWEERLKLFAEGIRADGVTLWQWEKAELVALANPLEPDIVGMRQPVGRGIISQAYLTGQAILETDPVANPHHDPEIDIRTGRKCRMIMAAPVVLPDGDGVLSAVRWQDAEDVGEFGLADLAKLSALALEFGTGGNDA